MLAVVHALAARSFATSGTSPNVQLTPNGKGGLRRIPQQLSEQITPVTVSRKG